MAQDQHRFRAVRLIARRERPAHQRRDAHQLEKIGRDDRRLNALRLLPAEECEGHRMMLGQIGQRLILRAVIVNLLDREV